MNTGICIDALTCIYNTMEFNVAKCKVMHTGNKNNEFSYEMNGKVLDKVLIEKDLGIPAI